LKSFKEDESGDERQAKSKRTSFASDNVIGNPFNCLVSVISESHNNTKVMPKLQPLRLVYCQSQRRVIRIYQRSNMKPSITIDCDSVALGAGYKSPRQGNSVWRKKPQRGFFSRSNPFRHV